MTPWIAGGMFIIGIVVVFYLFVSAVEDSDDL